MLENDLILERFLDARGEAITDREIAALDRLLRLGDNELWDLLSGRREPEDAAVKPLLETLRAICRPEALLQHASIRISAWSDTI